MRTDSDATRRSAPAARLARLLARIAGTALAHAEARGLPLSSAPLPVPVPVPVPCRVPVTASGQWQSRAESHTSSALRCAVRTQSDPIRSDQIRLRNSRHSTQLNSYTKLRCLCARA